MEASGARHGSMTRFIRSIVDKYDSILPHKKALIPADPSMWQRMIQTDIAFAVARGNAAMLRALLRRRRQSSEDQRGFEAMQRVRGVYGMVSIGV